jgi:hypothetical protein
MDRFCAGLGLSVEDFFFFFFLEGSLEGLSGVSWSWPWWAETFSTRRVRREAWSNRNAEMACS